MADKIKGQCLCGSVAFEITTSIPVVDACHCKMCQRWSGGPFIGASISRDSDIAFAYDDTLTWYDSSDWARRGFCSVCGSSLFYKLNDQPEHWAIAAGCLDLPDGVRMQHEIFVDEKPGYYAFAGDHPRLTGEETMAAFKAASAPES